MQLRRFRGKELPDVMRQIREELGPDAVILHTKQARPRGLLRFSGDAGVEVVAALDPTPEARHAAKTGAEPSPPRDRPDRRPAPRRATPAPPARSTRRTPQTVEEQIAELRELVVRLGGIRLLTPELVGLWERLVSAGVDESLAHATLSTLPRIDEDGRALGADTLIQALEERLVSMVPLAAPRVTDRAPVVAVVGPPGAGKTTTLAKLAARARITGVEVDLASFGDGLLGTASPLEAFATIIGATYVFASSPDDLAPLATDSSRTGTLLIDTPGISLGDQAGRAELETFLRSVAPTEVHLVLPATVKTADALAAIRAFRPLGVTSLVWTRMDETTSHGTVLSVSLEAACPLAWFGTGPDVPGDLEPASGADLVHRVLGVEVAA
jgi:flagellar biosynthesis protein FlhF